MQVMFVAHVLRCIFVLLALSSSSDGLWGIAEEVEALPDRWPPLHIFAPTQPPPVLFFTGGPALLGEMVHSKDIGSGVAVRNVSLWTSTWLDESYGEIDSTKSSISGGTSRSKSSLTSGEGRHESWPRGKIETSFKGAQHEKNPTSM